MINWPCGCGAPAQRRRYVADRYVLSTISAEAARSARADPAVTGSRRGSDRVCAAGPASATTCCGSWRPSRRARSSTRHCQRHADGGANVHPRRGSRAVLRVPQGERDRTRWSSPSSITTTSHSRIVLHRSLTNTRTSQHPPAHAPSGSPYEEPPAGHEGRRRSSSREVDPVDRGEAARRCGQGVGPGSQPKWSRGPRPAPRRQCAAPLMAAWT